MNGQTITITKEVENFLEKQRMSKEEVFDAFAVFVENIDFRGGVYK